MHAPSPRALAHWRIGSQTEALFFCSAIPSPCAHSASVRGTGIQHTLCRSRDRGAGGPIGNDDHHLRVSTESHPEVGRFATPPDRDTPLAPLSRAPAAHAPLFTVTRTMWPGTWDSWLIELRGVCQRSRQNHKSNYYSSCVNVQVVAVLAIFSEIQETMENRTC